MVVPRLMAVINPVTWKFMFIVWQAVQCHVYAFPCVCFVYSNQIHSYAAKKLLIHTERFFIVPRTWAGTPYCNNAVGWKIEEIFFRTNCIITLRVLGRFLSNWVSDWKFEICGSKSIDFNKCEIEVVKKLFRLYDWSYE